MKSVSLSHVGRIRLQNQDSIINLKDLKGNYFFCVADGMGGHKAGDVASKTLTDELEKFFKKCDKKRCFADPTYLKNEILGINKRIFYLSQSDSDYEGMGTTLTLCITNGKIARIYQVGDSRAYLIRDGEIARITKDQSLVQYMVDTNQITKEEALTHPGRHVILSAVGTEEDLKLDMYDCNIYKDDKILVCSDGLSDCFKDEEILEIIKKEPNMKKCTAALVSEANQRGGRDNISVVLFEA